MKKKVLWILTVIVLLCTTTFLILILLPRNYNSSDSKIRKGTLYWDLATNSRIAYTFIPAKGEKKPFPVIFLQGGPGGPVFDRNIEMLLPMTEDGYEVYLYDQVGCGFSERLENIEEYTAERHKRDLEEIVKIVGAEKVILIGQSWGAMLATMFVTDNREKTEKLIVTSPGPILPLNHSLENILPPDSLHLRNPVFSNKQGNQKAYNVRTKFVQYFAKAFNWKLAADKEMDAFSCILNFETGKSTVCDTSKLRIVETGYGYYCMVKTVQSFANIENKREKLQQSKTPVLILKGQCDNIKWGYTNEYLTLFQNHKFILVPDAGHAIAEEQPEIYLTTIRNFLNGKF